MVLLDVEDGKARIVAEGPPTFTHSASLERGIWKLLGNFRMVVVIVLDISITARMARMRIIDIIVIMP